MTTIKTACNTCCEEVSLTADYIDLCVFPVNREYDFYEFDCPKCHAYVKKYLADSGFQPEQVIRLLWLGGIEPTLPTLQDTDMERIPELPPVDINEPDVFRFFLESESNLAVFASV